MKRTRNDRFLDLGASQEPAGFTTIEIEQEPFVDQVRVSLDNQPVYRIEIGSEAVYYGRIGQLPAGGAINKDITLDCLFTTTSQPAARDSR